MTPSSERETQPVPKLSKGTTQELPIVKAPKYNPRHKKENNTGAKFLLVLFLMVVGLGVIAYVDWSSLAPDEKANPKPSPTVPMVGPTVTETSTVTEKPETRTVAAEPLPGPTSTVTISPSVTPTATATATETATVVVTETQPVPGPTKTVTAAPVTVIKCYGGNPLVEIECP